MNNQAKITIILFFAFAFLVSLVPSNLGYAAKFQSGVTINAPSTNETAPAGTCGLQIMTGAPINYGQLNVGQVSNEQKVTIKNVGTATAKVIVKASNWVGGIPPNDTYNAEITRVALIPGKEFGTKFPLHSSEATALGDLGPGQEGDSFWSVFADPHLSGSPHQEVTLDLTC